MIIGISGSQGQGKTTLLNELNKEGYLVVPNKTSRTILSEWNVDLQSVYEDKQLTVKFHEEIMHRHYINCLEAISLAKQRNTMSFIERSYADIFAYALCILGPFNSYNNWLKDFFNECAEKQKIFSTIIYLGGRKYVPVNDGVRSTNQRFARIVDYSIKNTLKEFDDINHTNTNYINDPDLCSRIDSTKIIANKFIYSAYGIS